MGYDAQAVKAACRGRAVEVLEAAGIPRDLLDGKHHPCPKCGGTDRFRLIDASVGAVLCNVCFAKQNGDILAAVQWSRGCTFPDALRFAAEVVGVAPMNGHANGHAAADPLDALCRAKRMPVASATAYGARINEDCVVFPSWGPGGEMFAPFTIKPSGTDKQRKGLWPKGSKGKCGVFLPAADGQRRLPAAGEVWLVVEGVKDAAALHGLGYLALGLPTCHLGQRFVGTLRGIHVVFVPDRDAAGINAAEDACRKLYGGAASIAIAALPAPVVEGNGKDVRDVLAMPDGEQIVREAIENAAAWERPADATGQTDSRPRILIRPEEHLVADEAVAALAKLPGLYQRGGQLAMIVTDPAPPPGIIRPPGSLYITALDEDATIDRLSQAAQFYKIREGEDGPQEVDVPVPTRIAKIVRSRRNHPGIPVIEGIIRAPAFLADGSILATSGYNPRTGLYLAASDEFSPVPGQPTREDAERARDELLEVVADFPFTRADSDPPDDPGATHRAAWLALALTPAARFAFDGPTPLGAFDANVRGSGKSKLADSIAMIHLGHGMPRTAYPEADDELRKGITATLLAGERLMLLDNVARTLGGPALDALLTASTWNERILGLSKLTGRLAATTIWLASGNNLVFGADTARRALVCRLESREENPEERTGFRHADLLGWTKANRGRLAVAAVTILRAYHVAGRPSMGLTEWGSFEGWSRLIRHAIVWCGMPDPGATRQEVREQSDREAGLLRQLLAAWPPTPCTVREAVEIASRGENKRLQDAFAEMATPGKPLSVKSVGMKLHHLRGRVCGGRWFECNRDASNTTTWTVAGTTGTYGTNSSPPTRARTRTRE